MGAVELWLGPAGCGKTGRALQVLREELDRDWRGVRYLVPTVSHKRSIEHLLLARFDRPGLFGDPVTTFFNFAEEVKERGMASGQRISELQKELLLRKLVREAPLRFFDRARRYPGFARALEEAIDELKVSMVMPQTVLEAAAALGTRGAAGVAQKLHEMGSLYAEYQHWVSMHDLYDSEGIMWIAAMCLQQQPALYQELHCLILDGFARLTPIQVDYLQALAPRVGRIIVLFDYEEGRTLAYHPVQVSLDQLAAVGLSETAPGCLEVAPPRTALEFLRTEIFRDRARTVPPDDSLGLFIGATPVHEAALIAREVRALLLDRKAAPGEIAILARDADRVRSRLARTFPRFGLAIRQDPPPPAHTPVGRALLAAFRLLREHWKREDVLTLLKSGFLSIDALTAFHIDLIARTHYLRERKSSWLERWPDDATRAPLAAALAPLLALDDAYHTHGADPGALLAAVSALLAAFHAHALLDASALPDIDAEAARRQMLLEESFRQVEQIFTDLDNLNTLLGGFRPEETLEVITAALVRATGSGPIGEGIPVLSAHTTGGEKFKVVFLCNLQEGAFPRHQRESAFLMDHERDETLRDLRVPLDPRRSLEEDERYWFLHALSTAGERLVLCYAQNDVDGAILERSSFLDEVDRLLPALAATARRTTFRDVAPSLEEAGSKEEFLAGLACALRTVHENPDDSAPYARLAAAYTAAPWTHGADGELPALFRRAAGVPAAITSAAALAQLAARAHPFSASELQRYLDCPFLWFAGACLGVEKVMEQFSPLDRGLVIHRVLENLYRRRQSRPGQPVHLEGCTVDMLWPEVEADLRAHLENEPRYRNRTGFLRDIEWESLTRMLRRFLRNEITRAQTRQTHPAFFERSFGFGKFDPLPLGGGAVTLRGKIDRIDVVDDDPTRAVVVDYKSSAGMTLQDLAAGRVLQAPIYVLALERLLRLRALGAEFMGLKQGESVGVYREEVPALYGKSKGLKTLDDLAWTNFLTHSEARLCAAAAATRAAAIPLAPTTPRCPDGCDHFALCRGNAFALARQVRAAKGGEEATE